MIHQRSTAARGSSRRRRTASEARAVSGAAFASWSELLDQRAEDFGPRTAYRFLPDDPEALPAELSYRELRHRARALAAYLGADLDRGPVTSALILCQPGLDYVIALFGCLLAGVAAVPAYPPLRPRALPRLNAIVDDARPRFVLTTRDLAGRLRPRAGGSLAAARWVSVDDPAPAADRGTARCLEEYRPDGSDLALLQYTSGSTGDPKGVAIGHGALLSHSAAMFERFAMQRAAEVVSWLPPYHDMGLVGGVLQPVFAGVVGTLLSPTSFLRRPMRWLHAISGRPAVVSGGPDFAYDLVARRSTPDERRGLDLTGWRVAFNGAEPVRAATLERFASTFADQGFNREALYPCYGLAEAILMVSGGDPSAPPVSRGFEGSALERGEARPAAPGNGDARLLVGCGRALDGHSLAITDPLGRPCAEGVIGEIRVSGPTLALGYWRRPAETERAFGAGPGGRWLRTGDLGFVVDGELFVTGRSKDLLIVRGRNLAPQDLEVTAEAGARELTPGAVAAFALESGSDGERVVLVAEIERSALPRAGEIAAVVRRKLIADWSLPVHEVAIVRPGGVPRTTSGKVRRRACRQLYLAGELPVVGSSRSPAEPRSPVGSGPPAERSKASLAALIAELAASLAGDDVRGAGHDLERPLVELGLDSLQAADLCRSIEIETGRRPSLEDLLAGASARGLAAGLEPAAEAADPPPREALRPATVAEEVGPLSAGQRSLWLLSQLGLDDAANHVFVAARLLAPLAPEMLRHAFTSVLERHDALRTTFLQLDGEPMRRLGPAAADVGEITVTSWSEAEIARYLTAQAHRPFELASGPPVRLRLLLGADGRVVRLLWVFHHLVCDLASLVTVATDLAEELAMASDGAGRRRGPELPALTYGDYVAWQNRVLAGGHGERLRAFWRGQLAELPPPLALPADRPRPALKSGLAGERRGRLPIDFGAAPPLTVDGARPTPFVLLAAAFAALLQRLSGTRELILGFPASGRSRAELAGLVGYLANLLPLRLGATASATFADLVAETARRRAGALGHQELPLAEILACAEAPRDPSRSPLFDVVLALHDDQRPQLGGFGALALGEPSARVEVGPLVLGGLPIERRASAFDLVLTLAPIGDAGASHAVSLLYDRALYDDVTAERLVERFVALVSAAMAEPATELRDLPLLTAAERAELSRGPRPIGVSETLVDLFEHQATGRPDAVALDTGEVQISYRELDRRSRELAERLRTLGAGPEARVGVIRERDADLVVAILAALRAGAAYLPLEPTDPPERRSLVLTDAEPIAVLGSAAEPEAWRLGAGGGARRGAGRPGRPHPENAAYVIYTSGSTGTPKGVVVSHANAVRLLAATRADFQFGPDDAWTLFHSTAFDFSVWEIWGALAHGGRLVIVPRAITRSPRDFRALLDRRRVTVLCQTPTAFRQLAAAGGGPPGALRTVVFGGEALEPRWLASWLEHPGGPRLVNMYGITETTVHVTYRPLTARDLDPALGSPIGEPIHDLGLRLLDRRLEGVPTSAAGEIHVAGAGLARGYLGRPGLTAERFVPDLWASAPGARLYRSGDLARRTAGGELVYLGRADQQLKIRGFRIEPGEIEAALIAHPEVREAVVTAHEVPGPAASSARIEVRAARRYLKLGPRGTVPEKRLAAYVVPASGRAPGADELRAFLGERLPPHLLPAIFVSLPALPLDRNGKLDRRSLPDPGGARPELDAQPVPPDGADERALAAIWQRVLGLEVLGVEDDFFALGGDSILSLRIQAAAAEEGLHFELQDLFAHPTVRRLAAVCTRAPRRGSEAPPWDEPPLPAGVAALYPLARMQAGLLYHSEQHPGSSVYRASFLYRLRGPCEPWALRRAATEVSARHAILRTSFDLVTWNEPMQVVRRSAELPLVVVDLRRLTPRDRDRATEAWLAAERRRDFDWREPPLARLAVLRLQDELFELALSCHDTILDGWSTALLIDELLTRHAAARTGHSLPTAPPPVGYRDFVALERRALAEEGERAFWRDYLEGAEATRLPRRRSAEGPPRLGVVDVAIDPELDAAIVALARRAGVSPKHVTLAAHLLVLAVMTGEDDVVTGLEANGRPESAGAERAVGQFLNTVPLRQRLDRGSFLDWLRRTFDNERAILPHRRFPYAEIQKLSGGRPLYESTFNYTHFHVFRGFRDRTGLEVVGGRGRELTHYALKTELNRDPFDDRLQLDVVFDRAELSRAQARAIAACYLRVFSAMTADPRAPITTVSWLSAAERHQALVEPGPASWSGGSTRAAEPLAAGAGSLDALVFARARLTPDAIAVVAEGRALSYRQLAARALRLAGQLTARGVGPESIVGVHLERSPAMVIALLGVLASGAAWLPLTPDQPAKRLEAMATQAAEAQGRLVVVGTEPASFPAVVEGLELVHLGEGPARALDAPRGAEPGRAAYVLFTSGSTGHPTGVVNVHRGIVHRLAWMQEVFGLTAEDAVLQKTPVSFDVSVWELFWPLATGARLVLAGPAGHLDPGHLAEVSARERISVLHFVPSLLPPFLEAARERREPLAVRWAIASGETLERGHVAAFHGCAPLAGAELWNLYGPTEAAIDVSLWRCERCSETSPPIGWPAPGQRIDLLDTRLQTAPIGALAELHLGGVQLARGYLGRPALTAERFVPDPAAGRAGRPPGERLYRTGDLGRRRADGAIEHVGRRDGQVKIRGQRIELGEIEATLAEHPEVREAAVVPRGEDAAHLWLMAFVVPARPGSGPELTALAEFSRARLPRSMVPARWRVLAALPRTASGKLDRKTLAASPDDPERGRRLEALVDQLETLTDGEAARLVAELARNDREEERR